MSANPQRMPLAQADVMESEIPAVASSVKKAAKATGEMVLGLLATMFGFEEESMATWAKVERVKWHQGIGR